MLEVKPVEDSRVETETRLGGEALLGLLHRLPLLSGPGKDPDTHQSLQQRTRRTAPSGADDRQQSLEDEVEQSLLESDHIDEQIGLLRLKDFLSKQRGQSTETELEETRNYLLSGSLRR